ncbi:MAG: hypothetical protein KA165_12850 [Saprospiraceae bacterium]|nr:hypothetical protein [Saprospiraceae bacterium]
MSLTYWIASQAEGNGNLTSVTQYYEQDRQTVINQTGAVSTGLINFKFRGDEITVFAARNSGGQILELVALPCPPYYHDQIAEAIPGNILTEL